MTLLLPCPPGLAEEIHEMSHDVAQYCMGGCAGCGACGDSDGGGCSGIVLWSILYSRR